MNTIEKYKSLLTEKYHVTHEELNEKLNFWTNKFGNTKKSLHDFIWSLFNQLVNESGRNVKTEQELYTKLRVIYCDMYGFLAHENRNISHIQKLINYCDLKKEQGSLIVTEVHFIAHRCCPECDKLDASIISLEEALKTQPLPNLLCTREKGCFCSYAFITKVDENGRLIWK